MKMPTGVQYNHGCYQKFTMKSELKKFFKKSEKIEDSLKSIIDKAVEFEIDECTPSKPKRNPSSSSTSSLLPEICIFCSLDIKYKQRKPEYLRKCQVKQVRETLEKYAKEKNDLNMISLLSTNDITVAEAHYHPSCYQDYTRPKNSGKKNIDCMFLSCHVRVSE